MLPYATEQQVIKIVTQKLSEIGGGSTPSKDEIIAIVNKAIEDGEIVIDEPDTKDAWRVAVRMNLGDYHYIESYTDFFDTQEVVFDAISSFLETPITNSEEFNAVIGTLSADTICYLMVLLGTINTHNTNQRYLAIYTEGLAEPNVYNVLCSGYFGQGRISGDYDGLVDLASIVQSFAEHFESAEGYVQKNGEEY